MPKYRWQFSVEDLDGETEEIDVNGKSRDSDVEFVGTPTEADAEGDRRADLWEKLTGDWCALVTVARMGMVDPGKDG